MLKSVHIVVSKALLLKLPNPCITETVGTLLLSIDLILRERGCLANFICFIFQQ